MERRIRGCRDRVQLTLELECSINAGTLPVSGKRRTGAHCRRVGRVLKNSVCVPEGIYKGRVGREGSHPFPRAPCSYDRGLFCTLPACVEVAVPGIIRWPIRPMSNLYQARWWHMLEDGRMQCDLCPLDCRLHDGQRGACFVRQRAGGAMALAPY